MRKEKDLLGELEIPEEAYWGIHTQRAIENFPISGYRLHPYLIKAFALVKKAAAIANRKLGYLPADVAEAIEKACDELYEGKLTSSIVVDALAGGAGTSFNMNVNEVIANRATEILGGKKGEYRVSPSDHVNLHQSTNDTFPTALRIAALWLLRELEAEIARLQQSFQEKEKEFAGYIKTGRTQLQDAVPMTMGQEFAAFAEALARDRWRVFKCEERIKVVNIGGTAIGTGVAAPRPYIFLVIEILRQLTQLPLARAENPVEATSNQDALAEVSGILKAHAINLVKISNDLRLLSSPPFGEIKLPEVQAGSSIMPGKVNPVIPEAVAQVGLKVIANDLLINTALSHSNLQLNQFLPLISFALLESLHLLKNANRIFREKCVKGIKAVPEKAKEHAEKSPALLTALLPYIGYEKATEIARKAYSEGKSIREVLLKENIMEKEKFEKILSPENIVKLGYDPNELE